MSDAPRPEDATAGEDSTVPETSDASTPAHPGGNADSTFAPPTPESPAAQTDQAPATDATPEPTDEELAAAVPAVVRRAPRFGRVMLTGAGTPAAVGFLLGSLLPNSVVAGRVVTGLIVALGFAIIGGTITGLYVARADAVASKRADAERARLLAEQAGAPNPFMPVETDAAPGTTDAPAAPASAAQGSTTPATTDEGETR